MDSEFSNMDSESSKLLKQYSDLQCYYNELDISYDNLKREYKEYVETVEQDKGFMEYIESEKLENTIPDALSLKHKKLLAMVEHIVKEIDYHNNRGYTHAYISQFKLDNDSLNYIIPLLELKHYKVHVDSLSRILISWE